MATTDDEAVVLMWKQRSITKTVPLDKSSNIAIICTAGGYSKYRSYASTFDDDDLLVAFCHEFRPLDIHLQQAGQDAASTSKNVPTNPIIHDTQGLPTKPREPNILDALNVDNLHVSD